MLAHISTLTNLQTLNFTQPCMFISSQHTCLLLNLAKLYCAHFSGTYCSCIDVSTLEGTKNAQVQNVGNLKLKTDPAKISIRGGQIKKPKPCYRARPIPSHWYAKGKSILADLEEQGLIVCVTETSEYCSPCFFYF